MKDWRNTIIGTLAGMLVTFAVMFVSTASAMVTKDEVSGMVTQTEMLVIKESLKNSMDNHTRAIENLAKEVHNLREQMGRVEGTLKAMGKG